MDYDVYNREERYLCYHLFRLLHEPVQSYRALSEFLKRPVHQGSFRIYAEAALIRDAYYVRKSLASHFLDDMVRMLMEQESVSECRLYSELPDELSNGSKTHPKQIRQKAGNLFTPEEECVFGAMQGMFNAKPDLVVCINEELLIYEAKFTLDFDLKQMKRTENIGKIWAALFYAAIRDLACTP
ncbi:MAG: hypothetical protein ACOYOE_14160 [Chlorobium sp.]